ncbi:hypothetical protein JGI3_00686 [Candidatus Kryptobacter tengchongensis]|uniref:Uncharacterized protein n=1 Tax=Kryptobacter tengchongensis TaxID=1643429 RepID=A0A656DF16_KRYT1|nr:hypothetical protein [Candidatus Kryptobacter tengchongensis]CUS93693.1 hypothetical protein JGI20_00396 [Candidatus Kryptobacter tengchongensis]CUS95910.1 hypothetical protein JGI24_00023 [Candidatus Kryptobacter tengchongensis]CUU01681.1 hypothetical protein JGI2_00744 [Candidatus Kryptobacter tengchongensis]CUU02204.1 hypothetical protein JGI3_00686 [Candidatus Kryptobacter tengchongensis]
MKKLIYFLGLFVIIMFLFFSDVYSQCAMCKQNVTSSEEGMKFASGLNDGIVYLLVVPYLIFAGFAIVIYVSARRRKTRGFNLN